MMSARKIKNQPVSLVGSSVAIYYDSDFGQYQVKVNGYPNSTYYADSKNDAFSTAQHMRNNLFLDDLRVKKNPVKRKTAARTQKAAVGYVNRPSQITKKAPSKRLKTRRTINLQTPRGVFPNPSPRSLESDLKKIYAVKTKTELNAIYKAMAEKYYGNSAALSAIGDAVTYMKSAAIKKNPVVAKKEITVEQSLDKKKWTIFARFPDTPGGSKNAIEYAKAYNKKEPYLYLRVMTK